MSDKDGMKMFGYNTTPDTASNDNISVDARDEISRLTAESRWLHRELEAAKRPCVQCGRLHDGAVCPSVLAKIDRDRIAALEHQLAGFRWHRVDEVAAGAENDLFVGFDPGHSPPRFDATMREHLSAYTLVFGPLPSALPTGASE